MRALALALLEGLLLSGWLYAASGPAQVTEQGSRVTLSNGMVSTSFDLASGAWQAACADGTAFATDLKCSINAEGNTSTAQGERKLAHAKVQDAFGTGVKAEIAHAGARPFVLVLTLYDAAPFFLVQVRIPHAKGIKVQEVTLPEGKFYAGAELKDVCTLSNYWDGTWYTEIHPVDLTEKRPRWETYSHFFLCAYNRADAKSVILGPLFSRGTARVEAEADPKRDPRALFIRARCYYDRNPLTAEAETWESPPFIVCAPGNVFHGLEAYGAAAKAHRPRPLWSPPPSGWCSWDAGASSSQKELFANVDAMKSARLDEYGLRYVQLDDGWQQGSRCSGNWRPRPDRFPAGMKGVADYIRSKGFEPGLWIGPFGEDDEPLDHPEFAVPKSKSYDLSSPKFKEYFQNEMKLYVQDWGFHYIKADFLSYGGTASKTIPCDESYREAVLQMVEALKPVKGYLMTCINHEWLTAGWSDGQRLGNDVHGGDLTGVYVTLKCWPRRYFTNNTFWVGDPDMLHVNLPTDEQSQVWASFVALSGGATMSGDNIPKLPPSRLEILKKAYPAQGLTARPCDLFARPEGWAPKFPRIWDCKVRRPGVGSWDVVGLFNWTVDCKGFRGENQGLAVHFGKHLELDAAKRYLVYDFWRQTYLGAFQKEMIFVLPAASCKVLALHEEQDVPQVLGSDRHIVTGAEDLKRIGWDAARKTLSGATQTVKNTPYTLAVHIPAGLAVAEATAGAAAATVTKVSDCFAKVSFNTGETGKVDWAIAFQAADTKKERTAVLPPGAVDVRAMRGEIVLRNEPPLWTDQRHDIEGAPLVRGDAPDIGTTAPFWTAWFVGIYTDKQKSLVSEVCNVGEKNTQVFFEVLGDGKRLWASEVLKGGESAPLRVPVEGVKDLTLICHYVGGWFSSTKGVFRNPRLVKE